MFLYTTAWTELQPIFSGSLYKSSLSIHTSRFLVFTLKKGGIPRKMHLHYNYKTRLNNRLIQNVSDCFQGKYSMVGLNFKLSQQPFHIYFLNKDLLWSFLLLIRCK